MKTLYLNIFCCLICCVASAQDCPTENVTLLSQAQVDSFAIKYPDCEDINVSITVGPSEDIINLDGLANLRRMRKVLSFRSNTALVSIASLSNLKYADGLVFLQNPILENLDGLEGIDTISNVLSISSCEGIKNLRGLRNVRMMGFVLLRFNDSLEEVSGFDSAIEVGYLLVANCHSLTGISGFDNLQRSMRGFNIDNNSELVSIDGFGALQTIEEISIAYNGKLVEIPQFENLLKLETLELRYNGTIKAIEGFNALQTITKEFMISNSPSLETIDGFTSLDSIGEFEIENLPSLASLGTFDELTSIGGKVQIVNNDLLEDISGLSRVLPDDVDSLKITGNHNLSTCSNGFICHYLNLNLRTEIDSNAVNCSSIDDVMSECISNIHESNVDGLAVRAFPNPVTQYVQFLQGGKLIDCQDILLYAMDGKVTSPFLLDTYTLDVSHLPRGSYVVSINNGQSVIVSKLVKH